MDKRQLEDFVRKVMPLTQDLATQLTEALERACIPQSCECGGGVVGHCRVYESLPTDNESAFFATIGGRATFVQSAAGLCRSEKVILRKIVHDHVASELKRSGFKPLSLITGH